MSVAEMTDREGGQIARMSSSAIEERVKNAMGQIVSCIKDPSVLATIAPVFTNGKPLTFLSCFIAHVEIFRPKKSV